MKETSSYMTDTFSDATSRYSPVPFFKSRWGLLSLLTVGSGLYLYQRRGGSLKSLFNRVWDMGVSARNSIGSIAPSVSGGSSASPASESPNTGRFGTEISPSGIGTTTAKGRQSSPNSGI